MLVIGGYCKRYDDDEEEEDTKGLDAPSIIFPFILLPFILPSRLQSRFLCLWFKIFTRLNRRKIIYKNKKLFLKK